MKNDIIYMNIDKGDKLVVTPLPDVKLKVTGKTTKTIEGVEFKMKKVWTEDQLVEINEMKQGINNNAKAIERNAQAIERNAQAIERNAQAIERNAQAIKKLDGRMDNMEKRMGNVEVNLDKLVKHFNIA